MLLLLVVADLETTEAVAAVLEVIVHLLLESLLVEGHQLNQPC
jgi:hypothetical protein